MTRKKVIILSVLMLVVIGVCIGSYIYKSDFQRDRQNKVQEQSSNKSKKTTKQESSNSKNKSEEQEKTNEDDSKEKNTTVEEKTNISKEVNETKKHNNHPLSQILLLKHKKNLHHNLNLKWKKVFRQSL